MSDGPVPVSVALCLHCVGPLLGDMGWLSRPPTSPEEGCWVCGDGRGDLVPVTLELERVNDGVYRYPGAPEYVLVEAFGGERDEHDD